MAQQEIIEFSADDKALMDSINRINKQLAALQQNARGVGDALSKGGSGGIKDQASAFDKFGKSVENSLTGIGKFAKGVGNLIGDLGKLGAAMVGSVALGFKAINSGLLDIEKSSKAALQIQYLKRNFGDLGEIVDRASGGLIDYREQLEIIQKGRGIVSADQLGKLTELGTSIGIVSTNFNETTATLQLLDTILTGNAKGLKELSPTLYDVVKNNEKILRSKDGQINRQALINLLTGKGLEEIKRTAGILDSPFKKLMDMSNFIRKQGEDILGIFGGIAKIIGGIALPLGIGAASFAFGGPIIGIMGTVIGAAISGALLAGFSKLAMSLAGKDSEEQQKMLTSRIDILREVLGGSLMQLLTGEGKYFLPNKMLEEAGYMDPKDKTHKISAELFGNDGLINSVGRVVAKIREFLLGFIAAFEGGLPEIVKDLEKISASFANLIKGLGGSELKTTKDYGEAVGAMILTLLDMVLGGVKNSIDIADTVRKSSRNSPWISPPAQYLWDEYFGPANKEMMELQRKYFEELMNQLKQIGAAQVKKVETEMALLKTGKSAVDTEREITNLPASARTTPVGLGGTREKDERTTNTNDAILKALARISEPTQNALMIEQLQAINANTKKIADSTHQRGR